VKKECQDLNLRPKPLRIKWFTEKVRGESCCYQRRRNLEEGKKKFAVGIDTAGTFTNGFFTRNRQIERVKVDTTPHNLTVCFAKCLEGDAVKLGLSLHEMFCNTEVVRFLSTIGTNILLTESSPKVGLIVTKGFEDSLYAEKGVPNPLHDFYPFSNDGCRH
jgi:hypothetical protein